MLLALSGPASLTALSNAGWVPQPDAALHLARAETGTPSPTKELLRLRARTMKDNWQRISEFK